MPKIISSDKKRLKLVLCYDGTRFFGWQKNSSGLSIEQEVEKTLSLILQEDILLEAASRTDRGVHALMQVTSFSTKKEIVLDKLFISLNQLLPSEIRAISIEEVSDDFHPTLDARSKTYQYQVFTKEILSPFLKNYSWHFPFECDLTLMRSAASLLVGKKDFKGFTNFKKNPHKDTIREIFDITITQENELLVFLITGDHFLYKMVRNIVGTLCYIGCKKLELSSIETILENKLRNQAGMTAPASGLFLKKITYK